MATPDYEPQLRAGHALVEYNGCTYLIGGQDSNEEPIDPSLVAVFDPATLKWQRRTTTGDIPEAVVSAAYTVHLHSFYCVGGYIQGERHNKMWRLDLTTLEWSSIQQKKTPPPRSCAGLVACNGVALLLYGGIGGGSRALTDLHVYSLQGGEWSTPAVTGHPPPPLKRFSFTLVGSRAVLFAGLDDSVARNDVYCLDIDRKHWSKELVSTGGPQPHGRWAHAAVALSSQALLSSGGFGGVKLDDCWILDLSTWRWREVVLPGGGTRRDNHAAAAVRIENTVTIMEFGGVGASNVRLAATSVLQMTLDNESRGGAEQWKLVDYITTQDSHKWKKAMERLHKLGLVRQALHDNKTISITPVSLILIGPPRSGKSTILQRLIKGVHYIVRPGEELPSTPLAGQPLSVEVRRLSPTMALVQQTRWINHDYSGEKRLLVSYFLRKMPDLLQEVSTAPDKVQPLDTEEPMDRNLSGHSRTSDPAIAAEIPRSTRASLSSQPIESSTANQLPQQQQLSPPVAVPVYDSPQEILRAGLEELTLEEAEVSLEGSIILHILDTGGQPEYLEVLPGLLTGPAVDLLIFKLVEDLQKRYLVQFVPAQGEAPAPYVSSYTVEEALFQAYTCVSHHIPPQCPTATTSNLPRVSCSSSTLLVGTHADRVSEEEVAKIDEQLQLNLKEIELEDNQLIKATSDRLVFTVDNTDPEDKGFLALQDALSSTLERDFQPVQLPLSWMMFYLAIQSAKRKVLSLEQCRAIAVSCNISNDDDLRLALWYLSHQFGVLRYYPEVRGLEDTIFCDLQLLFDSISALITATCFQTAISKEEERLRLSGHCSHELLHRLLDSIPEKSLSVETIVTVLEHLRIVTPTKVTAGCPEYLVPCVLRMFPVETVSATVRASPAPILFTFERGYSPLGLFPQLLIHLASAEKEGWELKKTPFRNMATFHVGEDLDEVTLIACPKYYEVLFEGDASNRCQSLSETCCDIRSSVDAAIDTVKSGRNSTILVSHCAAFYCPQPQCSTRPNHPASRSGRKLKCHISNNVCRQSSAQLVWHDKSCEHKYCSPIFHEETRIFSIDDEAFLADELSGVERWLDLGLLLGLYLSTLVEVQNRHSEDSTACRKDMLHQWLSGYDQVKEKGGPTLRSLNAALQDPLIGCHSLASQLEQSLSCKKSISPGLHSGGPVLQPSTHPRPREEPFSHETKSMLRSDEMPTLPLLICFPAKTSSINIPSQLGISYAMLGPLLLRDDSGARTDALKAEHQGNADMINIAVLKKWLEGGGLQPVTWATLSRVMADIGQVALAQQINDILN